MKQAPELKQGYHVHVHGPDGYNNYCLVEFVPQGLTEVTGPDGEPRTVQQAPAVEVEEQGGQFLVRWRSRPRDPKVGLDEFEEEARRCVKEFRRTGQSVFGK
jgi:hypothetical protein